MITARHYAEALYTMTADATGQEAVAVVGALCEQLAAQGRTDLLEAVLLEYRKALLKHNALPELLVESAQPLTDASRRAIAQAFETGKGVEIRETMVPSLVAGARVRYNDLFADVSVHGKLIQLKRALS